MQIPVVQQQGPREKKYPFGKIFIFYLQLFTEKTAGLIIVFLPVKKHMKHLLVTGISAILIFTACKQDRYYDLTAGKYVEIEKDEKTGRMVNAETREPVYIYVDTQTKDTIYGATGDVVNGHVVKASDGKYDIDDEYKIKYGDYKKKVDGDEVKIKDGDTKIKIEDGEKKVKKDD